jgi:hypothetical protein
MPAALASAPAAHLASDELPMLIDLVADEPFHRSGYLLDRPCL